MCVPGMEEWSREHSDVLFGELKEMDTTFPNKLCIHYIYFLHQTWYI